MYIKRNLFEDLVKHLDNKEITIVVGPRQAGKTTLLFKLQEYLKNKGEKTLFLNFDLDSDRAFFTTQTVLVNKIKLSFGNNPGFVFLDEIQRKENAGLFLKGLYDMNLPYKFIVTGSGSLELKEKIHESLVGRKRFFTLDPVSFPEFLNYQTDYKFAGNEEEFLKIEFGRGRELLNEYMKFGGYPKVILAGAFTEKKAAISDIFQSFLDKDISALLHVEKSEDLARLIRLLAFQQGQLINYSELASSVGIALPTVKRFLWYLEKTYIFERIYPFTRKRKEIVKAPVGYFRDLGMSNFSRGTFGQEQEFNPNSGLVFQNLIFLLLQKAKMDNQSTLNFWRRRDGAEVDFILEKDLKPIPVEVRYTNIIKPEIPRSLRTFIAKYAPEQAWIIHLGETSEIMIDKTKVSIIPYYSYWRITKSLR